NPCKAICCSTPRRRITSCALPTRTEKPRPTSIFRCRSAPRPHPPKCPLRAARRSSSAIRRRPAKGLEFEYVGHCRGALLLPVLRFQLGRDEGPRGRQV